MDLGGELRVKACERLGVHHDALGHDLHLVTQALRGHSELVAHVGQARFLERAFVIISQPPPNAFSDVPSSRADYQFIEALFGAGLAEPCPGQPGKFCPDAPVKLFVTASTEVRAERRYRELRAQGVDTIKPRVLAEMAERDRRDSERAAAPLKAAPDAHLLDTSDMDADAAFAAALTFIASKGFRSAGP